MGSFECFAVCPRTFMAVRGWARHAAVAGLVLAAGCAGGPEAGGEAPPPMDARLRFVDATETAGLAAFRHSTGAEGNLWYPEAMGGGGGFFDYDGDGWQDVLLVRGGTWTPPGPGSVVELYRNDGDGTFSPATEATGLDRIRGYGIGFTTADYDEDGDQDLYLTMLRENVLLRNDADASGQGRRFVDVTAEAGVAGGPAWSAAATFFDADRDGALDLFVGNYIRWAPELDIWCTLDGREKAYCTPELYQGLPPRFFRGNGDGTFTDETEAAGFLSGRGKTLGVVELDVDRDGWPDLAVANDTEPDELYMNAGDGTFVERGLASGMALDESGFARAGMGIDAGVVDDTGHESLFVGNFAGEMIGVYRYLGSGTFLDRAAASGIGPTSLTTLAFGVVLFDADLDADLDLYVANGHTTAQAERLADHIKHRQPPHLFINKGDGTFIDMAPQLGGPLAVPVVGRGVAQADYDRDGDADVLVVENDGPAYLLRNDVRTGVTDDGPAYLRLLLVGQGGNRDALGAQVTVQSGR